MIIKIIIKRFSLCINYQTVSANWILLSIKSTFTNSPKENFQQMKQKEDDYLHQNTCKYRKQLKQQSQICLNIPFDQYEDYINKFPNYNKKQSHMAKAQCINQIERLRKVPMIEVVSSILCEQKGVNNLENQQIFNLISKSKHNLYKNILSAFKRHITECSDTFLMSFYENLSEDKWTFEHIKHRVSTNLALLGRFNLKIKNLSKNRNLKKIFNYFLKNSEKIWLQDSKIKDKDYYIQQINLMVIAQEKQILQNFTNCYKKQRKNSMKK
ncbi:hypothetical protein TTHERM_000090427 (macronuclear) [Tetrahymena thermophila SB210]|uniref:Uncharacterized protein n=1 Tax=Tetrahymena thermophila (strain SB210) TaxID=312017 RepID=W7XJ45_TETTS|nr:hypothetical protein TTHERM_000090427 [Tetrahymena thermophila SB210]EWS75201.1 hypothetical protein TTHERM_000090427 [Tetrahymena thermophila SB210]|eukprot:XP_012652192.1 hypothetical protein TTHERM_000090427 [Tetrahymena thermophila SB210]